MRLALAVVLLALAIPAAASAATAEVVAVQARGTYYEVEYQAAPGEVNDLTAAAGGTDGIVLTDSGAEIEPGEGCTPVTVHTVTCAHEDLASVDASLADEKDHFTSEGPGFDVSGGASDDVLDGGQAGGFLRGDGGEDVLQGGKTVTWFYGGTGDDTLVGTPQDDHFLGGPGADTIDGRGDFQADWSNGDTVDYQDHEVPVTVDLSKPDAPAGADGEGDSLANIESAYGGQGADTLTARKDPPSGGQVRLLLGYGGADLIRGGPANDFLAGGGGDDSVRGGGGNDRVDGNGGRDTLIGGAGTNELRSYDARRPERDSVRCGDGGSVVAGDAREPLLDVIDQSCTRIAFSDPIVSFVTYRYVGRPTRAVSSTVTCTRHCRVTIGLHAHGKLLGSATREIQGPPDAAFGRSATLTVPLPRARRDELARAGVLRLGSSMDVSWGARLRHAQATSWHLVLHDPPAAR